MSYLPDKSVAPLEPRYEEPSPNQWRKHSEELGGCLRTVLGIIIAIVGYIILAQFDTPEVDDKWFIFLYYLSPIIAAIMALGLIEEIYGKRNSAKNEALRLDAIESQRRRDREYAQSEAVSLSDRLNGIIEEAIDTKKHYGKFLDASRDEMKQAQYELDRNASVYFWDHYEAAIDEFEKAIRLADKICESASDYYRLLQNRQHTFPLFPVQQSELIWCTDVRQEISNLERRGIERGGDFVTVWEGRRTREAFYDASTRISDAMHLTMRRFEKSVSDEVARKVIEEIRRMKPPK